MLHALLAQHLQPGTRLAGGLLGGILRGVSARLVGCRGRTQLRTLPYEPNIDIRDTVQFKDVMKQYATLSGRRMSN